MFNLPNLFSDIFTKAKTAFSEVATVVENDYAALVKLFPAIGAAAAAEEHVVKQQLSNALNWVDKSVAPHYADAVSMIESAVDTGLLGLTKGMIAPGIPIINTGVEDFFAMLHGVLLHKEAQAKVALNLPAPTSAAQPTVEGLVAAVNAPLAPAS